MLDSMHDKTPQLIKPHEILLSSCASINFCFPDNIFEVLMMRFNFFYRPVPATSKLAMKSTNLAPLKMPPTIVKPSDATGDTPTTTTPGSGGSSTTSPQFPFPHMQGVQCSFTTHCHSYVESCFSKASGRYYRTGGLSPKLLIFQMTKKQKIEGAQNAMNRYSDGIYPENIEGVTEQPIHGFTEESKSNFFSGKPFKTRLS